MSNNSKETEYFYSPKILDPSGKYEASSLEKGKQIALGDLNLTILEKLGEGGFGSVYKCVDTSGKCYALKKIKSDKDRGVPCLFEASMMNSYKHPSLNSSIHVNASLEGLYILQDIAKYDLHGLITEHKKKGINDINVYKNILYRVAKGISFLHEKGLVHGDIKSRNILYYSDNDIRISDFNLTTMKKWKSNIHLCTALYRPIEIWLSKEWNEKIDVWAFGCVMYELLYKELLFPYQGEDSDKSYLKKKYINAIIDWGNYNSSNKLKLLKYNVLYKGIELPKELLTRNSMNILNTDKGTYDYEKELYLNLMLRCLQVLDKDRPSIDTIISDQLFFNIRSKAEYSLLNVKKLPSNISITKDFWNLIEKGLLPYVGNNDRELLRLSTYICANYAHIIKCDTHLIKRVSVWMSKKLLRLDAKSQLIPTLDSGITKDNFLKTEIAICNALQFKLHPI